MDLALVADDHAERDAVGAEPDERVVHEDGRDVLEGERPRERGGERLEPLRPRPGALLVLEEKAAIEGLAALARDRLHHRCALVVDRDRLVEGEPHGARRAHAGGKWVRVAGSGLLVGRSVGARHRQLEGVQTDDRCGPHGARRE